MLNSVLPQTVKEWLDKGEAVVVDVREPAEYESEHIAGAVSVPLGSVCCAKMPNTKGKKLVVHCHLGGRSRTACEKMIGENAGQDVWNLEGGLAAWKQAGFPVETSSSGRKVLPLNQQVQVVVGGLTLTGTLLGAFVNPAFYLIPGLLGLGLTFAGLTGFCGLACVLSHMPWNKASTCGNATCCSASKPKATV
ncbi:MAG: rhodanese-like domain-containing protein [Bdellovibrionales bacterium]